MNLKNENFKVYGMTCTSCEELIENSLKNLHGIQNVKADFNNDVVNIKYDTNICNVSQIHSTIKQLGYSLTSSSRYKIIGVFIIALAILILGFQTSGFNMEEKLTNASYGVLFIIGVFTSIHCVGMCGGIMLSQSVSKNNSGKFQAIKPSILYNLGRIISYTILGGIVGGIGSIFSISSSVKGSIQIIAALLMIILGLNMLGFKFLKKLNIKLPKFMSKLKNNSKSPLIVGILNGFMPCGPLQTMQIFALGTGSMTYGALSMFMFSLGTVPLMLGFGSLSGILNKGAGKQILKLSGAFVIVLGIIMISRGFNLYGININPLTAFSSTNENSTKSVSKDDVQVIEISANNYGYTPNTLYVEKDKPVKLIVNGDQLTSCNNEIVIPSLDKELKLNKGQNVFEFTPNDNDDIKFSCWMGMLNGVIKVVDNLDTTNTETPSQNENSSLPTENRNCCTNPIN